ncbi:MAG: pyridoxine 5'-phosphate synthase [Candidatus Omnitrophica bacterium]|nr:pyridoxine 5'-phosphate synthase [Candidatus Omnitrophota bacterium]MBU1852875.1 pyridoxine 5'-phosphate synthase [Candidatus Omnitrophota bacterium]
MPKLGVNVDHVATLREARGGIEPDPLWAASICEQAGCDSIVAHLREDRRHINDLDVRKLKRNVKSRFNLEMSINPEIVERAKKILPHQATLVPERRQELTTEGGLSVNKYKKKIGIVVEALKRKGIEVSIFIDPKPSEIFAAKTIGVEIIEIHTGRYSLARTQKAVGREYRKIKQAVEYALSLGLEVNAGHGLDYSNVKRIARIKGINELNIGHSIISRAIFSGLYKAVRDMKRLIR